ncbi:hypothetical protein GGP55_002202 [Salinibacter ruber]|nr:hypothetical protein [Salinibacter ruber]
MHVARRVSAKYPSTKRLLTAYEGHDEGRFAPPDPCGARVPTGARGAEMPGAFGRIFRECARQTGREGRRGERRACGGGELSQAAPARAHLCRVRLSLASRHEAPATRPVIAALSGNSVPAWTLLAPAVPLVEAQAPVSAMPSRPAWPATRPTVPSGLRPVQMPSVHWGRCGASAAGLPRHEPTRSIVGSGDVRLSRRAREGPERAFLVSS